MKLSSLFIPCSPVQPNVLMVPLAPSARSRANVARPLSLVCSCGAPRDACDNESEVSAEINHLASHGLRDALRILDQTMTFDRSVTLPQTEKASCSPIYLVSKDRLPRSTPILNKGVFTNRESIRQ